MRIELQAQITTSKKIGATLLHIPSITQEDCDIARNEGYQVGKQDEHNVFWKSYQDYGNRTDYMYGFYQLGWTGENFNPKYNMFPTNAHSMFRNSNIEIDLQSTLEGLGVTLDFKYCASMEYAFRYSKFTRIGVIDTTGCTETDLRLFLADCPNLKIVDKIILRKNGSTKLTNSSFLWSPNLEEIRFDGQIGYYDIDFQSQSKLSAESVQSIIDALMNLTGLTPKTLKFHRKVFERLTDEQKATIVNTKNWTLVC